MRFNKMPRLPTPGSDSGNWGNILNDFLKVSHKDDGTLKNRLLNVKDFGAKGDGITDDSTAFQNANNTAAALTSGGTILVPSSTYLIRANITISPNVILWVVKGTNIKLGEGVIFTSKGNIIAWPDQPFIGTGTLRLFGVGPNATTAINKTASEVVSPNTLRVRATSSNEPITSAQTEHGLTFIGQNDTGSLVRTGSVYSRLTDKTTNKEKGTLVFTCIDGGYIVNHGFFTDTGNFVVSPSTGVLSPTYPGARMESRAGDQSNEELLLLSNIFDGPGTKAITQSFAAINDAGIGNWQAGIKRYAVMEVVARVTAVGGESASWAVRLASGGTNPLSTNAAINVEAPPDQTLYGGFLTQTKYAVVAKTANYSVSKDSHTIFTNLGASNNITFTLPRTSICGIGFTVGFFRATAGIGVTVTPNSADAILGAPKGVSIHTLSAVGAGSDTTGHGDFLLLICTKAGNQGEWAILQQNGSWLTDAVDLKTPVSTFTWRGTIAYDGFIALPNITSGHGFGHGRATLLGGTTGRGTIRSLEFAVDSGGNVTALNATGAAVATDTDANLCVFNNGTSAVVKNRVAGVTNRVIITFWY
jgi:hypothetical protein